MISSRSPLAQWIDSGQWSGSSDTAMPMLPALAADVIALALDPDVSALRIMRVISKDQVLATRVLRLANSAYCAPMQEITTVNDAIIRMGTAAARSVVLAVCFASRLQSGSVYGTQGRNLVDHGIGTAYLARLVGERAGVDADEAFMYGLLHDIGKLLLMKLAQDFTKAGGAKPTPEELEAVLQEKHADLGAQLLRQWRVPDELVEPVQYHHDPARCERFPMEAAVCYVADRLSHRYGFGCAPTDSDDLLTDSMFVKIGADAAWLKGMDERAPGLFEVARQIVG
jgi:putative nucleotidyltransferase with HDIG domain